MVVSTGTAALIGGVTAGIGSIIGAGQQRGAISRAAREQTQAQREAQAVQERMLERQLEVQRPFREFGERAIGLAEKQLMTPLGPIEASETFRFRQQESERALNQALAARGLFNSGQAIRKSLGLTQRLISEELAPREREIARRQALLGTALGAGQQAVGLGSAALGQFGQQAGGIAQNIGQVQAQQALAQGRTSASLFGTLGALPFQTYGISRGLSQFQQPGIGAQQLQTAPQIGGILV